MDGRRQRNALTAAERTIQALADRSTDAAIANANKAAALDQVGVFAGLPAAVAHAIDQLDRTGALDDVAWASLGEAVPPGPLHALIDAQRR